MININNENKKNNSDNEVIDNLENDNILKYLILKELINNEKIKPISRIAKYQVPTLSKLYLFSNTFDNQFTRNLADNILELQISINGLGRKELVQLFKQQDIDISSIVEKKRDIFK